MVNADVNRTVIVIDDDPLIASSLGLLLPTSWKMIHWYDVNQDLSTLSSAHIIFCDLHLTPNSLLMGCDEPEGLLFLKQLKKAFPHLMVVAMSGDPRLPLMEQSIQFGATYFLSKPIKPEEVKHLIASWQRLWEITDSTPQNHCWKWIGRGPRSQKLLEEIARIFHANGPVLIEGESGVGKEIVAHLIGFRPPHPFLTVNVSTVPEHLFESEFFGYQKGAFTGAHQARPGFVEICHNGALFLDEIETLEPQNQAKLLRFIEYGEGRRLGSQQNFKAHVRIIAASNIPLKQLVAEGKFRMDLYQRLNQNYIYVPPLRERTEDLPELISFFLDHLQPKLSKTFTPEAIALLERYPFPGNVRELRKIVEQAAYHCPIPYIRPQDVIPFLTDAHQSQPVPGTTHGETATYDHEKSLTEHLKIYEKNLIQHIIKQTKDLDQARQILKISRSSLYKKLKDYNMSPNHETPQ
ncbi:MAG: sigma-54 dependent transcriptional regulator [Bdellovibrionaceae bacterium]|nr:sigma-54 dependent transcriptional regulator [Pseudobdellovibrionaceae bacterium]MDW8189907.1 sigma-54 dependent transcriptional regulator [Pseudobdellovibrionaceae bacterium]